MKPNTLYVGEGCGCETGMQSRGAGLLYFAGSVLFLIDGAQTNDMLGLAGGILFTLGSLFFVLDR